MNQNIIPEIKKAFQEIGNKTITGKEALQIVENIIDELTIPTEVEEAQKYIRDCNSDIGFCGSPEYDRQKAIVDAYYEPIRKKKQFEAEKAHYERLKNIFG